MAVSRRQWLVSMGSIGAGLAWTTAGCGNAAPGGLSAPAVAPMPIRKPDGDVDWHAVRALFPLAPDWIDLAGFLFVSHPEPVAEAIEHFRQKIDADPTWVERAALTDSEGRPVVAVKRALADYVGGVPEEIRLYVEYDRRTGDAISSSASASAPMNTSSPPSTITTRTTSRFGTRRRGPARACGMWRSTTPLRTRRLTRSSPASRARSSRRRARWA